MFFLKANLTQSLVLPVGKDGKPNPLYPRDNWCHAGHCARASVKFFSIAGETLPKTAWGIYCEDCIKIANGINRRNRQKTQQMKRQAIFGRNGEY